MKTLPPKILPDKIPRHIAVIMDGNGRWAKKLGWQRTRGHRAGADAVSRCVEACDDLGVEFLTLYAFSTENWLRPGEEVSFLMKLLGRNCSRHCLIKMVHFMTWQLIILPFTLEEISLQSGDQFEQA